MFLVNLLSTGPGAFVYHLLIFLVLEALVGITLVEYRRVRNPDHRRILWTFGGLMGMRVLLLIGEPLGPAVVAPILNGIELASLTFLGWAFLVPILGRRIGKMYLAGGLVATLLCAATFLPGWYETLARFPHLLYLTFWQQTFWYAVDILLALAPALVMLRLQRQEGQRLSLIAFGALSLGFATLCIGALFLTVGWLNIAAYTLVGIGRLINMLSYPLFAVAVHQAALRDWQARRGAMQGVHQTPALRFLVEASQSGGDSFDLDGFLNRVVEGTATTLDADLCAVFLVDPDENENEPETVNLTAQYAPFRRAGRPSVPSTVSLAEQPALAYALKRRRQLTFNVETDNPRLQTLYGLFGSQRAGPTIIQPILNQHRILGALVVGNNRSQRAFEPDAARTCRNIAGQVAAVLPF